MHRSRLSPSLALALAAAVSLAACSKPAADGAAAAVSTAADAASAPADAGAPPAATDTAASGFVLDMARADAYYATLARIASMSKATASAGDGEEDDVVAMDASESIDAYIARMEADPEAKRLITSAGMSVRDFAHTNAAMLEGMMAAGMMEATGRKEVPEGINPQYVAFVQAHKAELEAKMQALQAEAGQAGEE